MKFSALVASAAAITGGLTTDHDGQTAQCLEIDGYIKNCEEGLHELSQYFVEVTEPFEDTDEEQSITQLGRDL